MQLFGFSFYTGSLNKFVEELTYFATQKNKHTAIKVLPASMNDIVKSFFKESLFGVIKNFDYVIPDGMPLVFLQRFKGNNRAERLYGPDVMNKFLAISSKNKKIKHFFYGCDRTTLDKLEKQLLDEYPNLQIVGKIPPAYRSETQILNEKISNKDLKAIKISQANIIWIALGGSKQIYFVDKLAKELPGKIIIAVGAAFDFLSLNKKQAPRWMRKLSLEWLFRLIQEPKRLWRRYILQIPLFIVFFLLECLCLYLPLRRIFLCLKKQLKKN